MTTPAEARNLILQLYLDEFSGTFPIALPNQPFEPPEPAEGIKWVQLDVRFTFGGQDTLGAVGKRKFTSGGLIIVQVRTPNGDATNTNDILAKQSLDLLDSIRLNSNLWTSGGRVITVGTDGEWYLQNVLIDLQFEETR